MRFANGVKFAIKVIIVDTRVAAERLLCNYAGGSFTGRERVRDKKERVREREGGREVG